MYCIYSQKEPKGVEVESAEEAWKVLRSKNITDCPAIDVKLHVNDTDIYFCAATWYSVIYTGMDTIYDLPLESIEEGIRMIDALKDAYPVERKLSELSVIGNRDRVYINRTEKI